MEEIKDTDSIIADLKKRVEQQSTMLMSLNKIVDAKEKEVAELKKRIQDLEENGTYKGLSIQLLEMSEKSLIDSLKLENKKLEDINKILMTKNKRLQEENKILHERKLKIVERTMKNQRMLDCYRDLCLELSKLVPFYRFHKMERLIDYYEFK